MSGDEKLFKKGVCQNATNDLFHCHICEVPVNGFDNSLQHIRGRAHKQNFERVSDVFEIRNKKIICKVCTFEGDWANFMRHINKKRHISSLAKITSLPSQSKIQQSLPTDFYRRLLKSSVCRDRTAFCKCLICKQYFKDWSSTLDHINGSCRSKFVTSNNQSTIESIEQVSENEAKGFVENWICLNGIGFYCNCCQCQVSGLKCLHVHIKGQNHTELLHNMTKPQSNGLNKGDTKGVKVHNTCAGEKSKMQQWYSENFIMEVSGGSLQCKLCNIRLSGPQPCMDHVAGYSHRIALENAAKHTERAKSATVYEKIQSNASEASSSSHQESLFEVPENLIPLIKKHKLQHLAECLRCVACNVDMKDPGSITSHTSSTRHENKLKIYREQLREDIITNILESPGMKTLIEKHFLMPLRYEIDCLLCNVMLLNEKSLHDHIQSARHLEQLARNKQNGLVYSENKVFCTLCSATMNEQKTVDIHIKAAKHQKNMSKVNANNGLYSSSNASTTSLNTKFQSLTGTKNHVPNTNASQNTSHTKTLDIANKPVATPVVKMTKQLNTLSLNRMKRAKDRPQRNVRKKQTGLNPKHLGLDMQHIYDVSPEKRRLITVSCQLSFPNTGKTIYCLVCEKSISSQLQTYYEHICQISHLNYLAEMEQDDLCFEGYREQFSDLALSKEFMQETSEEFVQCFACDVKMENDDPKFHEHIATNFHKQQTQQWKEACDKIMEAILSQLENNWYYVQKYWCQPCNMEFGSEIGFAIHLEHKAHVVALKKHGTLKNRLIYDSCAPCALLWIGYPGLYTQHCQQKVHHYLVNSGDYMIGDMPRLAKILLDYAEKEVMDFIAKSDEVLSDESQKANSLLESLEDAVRDEFPDAKAYPFGSRVSGLSLPGSDIDVFLDCGDMYDGTKFTEARQDTLIRSVQLCLTKDKKTWEIEEVLTSSRTPIIRLRHRKTDLRCDISFKNGLSVENTKLLKCYIDLYPLCRKVILLVKKWLTMCNLSGSHCITNYAICWYVIFYLQWKEILPSVAQLIAMKNESKIIAGWEAGICHEFTIENSGETFLQLLHGFFEFYAEFDYRFQVACPLLGNTIEKQSFSIPEELPEEMAPYIHHVQTSEEPEFFRIDSAMCIQDPLDLSHNLTKAVRRFTLNHFRHFCAISAEILSLKME